MGPNNHHHRHPPWLDLPTELLTLITNHLRCEDLIKFSVVCKHFRHVASTTLRFQSLQHPWLLIDTKLRNNMRLVSPIHHKTQYLSLPETRDFLCFGASMGWLTLNHRFTRETHLINPFTDQRIALPRYPQSPRTCFEVTMMTIYPSVTVPNPDYHIMHARLDKTILSCYPSPNKLATKNCVVLTYRARSAAYCCPGDSRWTHLAYGMDDVLFFHGLLYCLLPSHKVIVYEFGLDPVSYEFGPHPISEYSFATNHSCVAIVGHRLVEWAGEVLMVVKYIEKILFKVYRIEQSSEKWVEVSSLGDEMIIFGDCDTISVNAENFSRFGFRRNRIYFKGGKVNDYRWLEFCLEDKSVRPLAIGDDSPPIDFSIRCLSLRP